jgi:hypothetical protein
MYQTSPTPFLDKTDSRREQEPYSAAPDPDVYHPCKLPVLQTLYLWDWLHLKEVGV